MEKRRAAAGAFPVVRAAVLVLVLVSAGAGRAAEAPEPTVGMPGRLEEVVIPGTELEPLVDDARNAPIVLRVVAVFPHGDALRYDFEFYGLEPGAFDLRDFLRRRDGSAMDDVPPMPVRVRSLLDAGVTRPHEPTGDRVARPGGYRLTLIALGIAWVAGLAALVFAGRRGRSRRGHDGADGREPTFADRLRPLVEQASAGTLPPDGQAELERLVLRFWRARLGLADTPAAEAWRTLREHEEAGPLVRRLESWLHRPGGSVDREELGRLLEPFTHESPETGESEPAPAPAPVGRKEVAP